MEKVLGDRSRSKAIQAFIFALPLIAGGLIYVFLRFEDTRFLNWMSSTGIENLLQPFRKNILLFSGFFPDWFVNSLPNGFWAFSYAFLISLLWWGNNSLVKYFWLASIPVLVFGFEILQLTSHIPGTFCLEDLLFGALGIAFGFFTAIKSNFLKSNFLN